MTDDRRPFRVRRARLSEAATLAQNRLLLHSELRGKSDSVSPSTQGGPGGALRSWIRRKMRQGRLAGFLAEDDSGRTVGSGFVWLQEVAPRPDRPGRFLPRVQAMYTVPSWRNRGVGSAILERAVEWARARGFERVVLHSSSRAERFYRAKGFTPVPEMWHELGKPVQRRARPRRRAG